MTYKTFEMLHFNNFNIAYVVVYPSIWQSALILVLNKPVGSLVP